MANNNTPYFITLIVGVLGWTLSHIVDRIENSPVLKYSVTQRSSANTSSIALTIKNITENKTFKKVTLVLAAPEGSTFTDAAILAVEPAFEGDQPWKLADRTAQFTIPAMQPGWEFHIVGHYKGVGNAVVHFESGTGGEAGTLRALEPSLETYLAEHESEILYGLLVVWAVVLCAYFVLRPRATGGET